MKKSSNIDINLEQLSGNMNTVVGMESNLEYEVGEVTSWHVKLVNIKKMSLPFKVEPKDTVMIKFVHQLFDVASSRLLDARHASEWITLNSAFFKQSGNSWWLELNDIDYVCNVAVYKSENIYIVNEIMVARSFEDQIKEQTVAGCFMHKLATKSFKDDAMINCSSNFLPLLGYEGYLECLNMTKSTTFECRLSVEISEMKDYKIYSAESGLYTFYLEDDCQWLKKIMTQNKVFMNNLEFQLPKNFETIQMNEFKKQMGLNKAVVVSRELRLTKLNKFNYFEHETRTQFLNYKNNAYLADIVVVEPMLKEDTLVAEVVLNVQYKLHENDRKFENTCLYSLIGAVNFQYDKSDIQNRKYKTLLFADVPVNPHGRNLCNLVQLNVDDPIVFTFDASNKMMADKDNTADNQVFTHKDTNTNQNLNIYKQKEDLKNTKSLEDREFQIREREKELDKLERRLQSNRDKDTENAKGETLNFNTTSNNKDFNNTFATLKSEMVDQRIQDLNKENEALKMHNHTLIKTLNDKDSLVTNYLSKLTELQELVKKLETKSYANVISPQANMNNAPYQDQSSTLHPNGHGDTIDMASLEQIKNVRLKDEVMYENAVSKQHLLKLSSLGINIDASSHKNDQLDLSGPIAFDVTLSLISLLDWSSSGSEAKSSRYQFNIKFYDFDHFSPVLHTVNKKITDTEYRSMLTLNPSMKLGDDNMHSIKMHLDSTRILRTLENNNVKVCDTTRTLHLDLLGYLNSSNAVIQIYDKAIGMYTGYCNLKLGDILDGQVLINKEYSWYSYLSNKVGGLINISMKVESADPAVSKSELDSIYNAITYSHELGNMDKNLSNSNQIDDLDSNKHIDPIYAKIKKFSNTHTMGNSGSSGMFDKGMNLDAKAKMNNDIMYIRDKMKENKLRNLVKYGNNNTVSVNVRYGNTSVVSFPIKNESDQRCTYSIKIEDDLGELGQTEFDQFVFVHNSLEYQQIRDKFQLKHVDINQIGLNGQSGVTVDSNTTGYIIFKYTCLSSHANIRTRDVKILVSKDSAILKTWIVQVNPLSNIHENKVYRFNEPEQRHVKLRIHDFISNESIKSLHFISNNPKVSLGLNKDGSLVVSMLTKAAPAVDKFTVFVYSDKFYLNCKATLKCHVTSYQTQDLTVTAGHNTSLKLYLPPMNSEISKFQYVSSSKVALEFQAPYDYAFNPSATNLSSVEYTLNCKQIENSVKVLIHLIGDESNTVKFSQMLNISLSMPDISKQFKVPSDNKNVKFVYENQKGINYAYVFESSNPELLKVLDEKMRFNVAEKKGVNLEVLHPLPKGQVEEVMVFIKDAYGSLEDCILFKILGEQ